jgi:ribose transport system permease protein
MYGRVPQSGVEIRQFVERYALIGVWLILIAVFSFLLPDTFFTGRNFRIIFGSQTVLLVLTLGLVITLAISEYDLSVGAVLSFAFQTTVVLNVVVGLPIGLTVLTVVLAALLFGALNAIVIVFVGVHSIIATLASATLLTGIVQLITDNKIITGVSENLLAVTNTRLLGLPLLSYYGLFFCLFVWYVLQHTPVGRYLYFVGQGTEVARLAGVNVNAVRVGALVTAAAVAAVAGILLAGVRGSSTPENGAAWLLPAYAAAFLGATAVVPGRFNAWGSFVAVYFLVTGFTGLQLAGFSSWVQDVFYGGSLLIAVTLARLPRGRRQSL